MRTSAATNRTSGTKKIAAMKAPAKNAPPIERLYSVDWPSRAKRKVCDPDVILRCPMGQRVSGSIGYGLTSVFPLGC